MLLLPTTVLNERSLINGLKEREQQLFQYMLNNHRLSPPLEIAVTETHDVQQARFEALHKNIETCIKIARMERCDAIQKCNEELVVAKALVKMSSQL